MIVVKLGEIYDCDGDGLRFGKIAVFMRIVAFYLERLNLAIKIRK